MAAARVLPPLVTLQQQIHSSAHERRVEKPARTVELLQGLPYDVEVIFGKEGQPGLNP